MSLPFILEIGIEEIPDWMIVPALNQLQDMFQALLDQQSLGGRVEETHATPRRLFLRAGGLLERQADVEESVMGPAKSAGAGAAAGFARKQGTTVRTTDHANHRQRRIFRFHQARPGPGYVRCSRARAACTDSEDSVA